MSPNLLKVLVEAGIVPEAAHRVTVVSTRGDVNRISYNVGGKQIPVNLASELLVADPATYGAQAVQVTPVGHAADVIPGEIGGA